MNQGTFQVCGWARRRGVRRVAGSRRPRRGGFGPGMEVGEREQPAGPEASFLARCSHGASEGLGEGLL